MDAIEIIVGLHMCTVAGYWGVRRGHKCARTVKSPKKNWPVTAVKKTGEVFGFLLNRCKKKLAEISAFFL